MKLYWLLTNLNALTTTNKKCDAMHGNPETHTVQRSRGKSIYAISTLYLHYTTLYFTPLFIHQSEHHWGADCAIFFAHQQCLNSSQFLPEGLWVNQWAPLGDGEHTWQTSYRIFIPHQTSLFHGHHRLWYTWKVRQICLSWWLLCCSPMNVEKI